LPQWFEDSLPLVNRVELWVCPGFDLLKKTPRKPGISDGLRGLQMSTLFSALFRGIA
jgi:hypothetical protein